MLVTIGSMRSRILGLRRVVAAIPQINAPRAPQFTQIRTYKVNQNKLELNISTEECDAHMNELPVPCGPWEPWYQAKQSLYNKVFVFGVAWFLFSFAMMIMTDSIYLNFSPPAQPGPPSDMGGDCEEE